MGKKIKKITAYTLAVFFIFGIIFFIKVFFDNFVTATDSSIRDYMFKVRGEIQTQKNVIIVDIDEKSLLSLGQWPWSRDKLAQILMNLALANVGVIGLDIVFAETDRSSPAKVFKQFNVKNIKAPDYDKQFNYIVANTPTILGYQFELTNKKFLKQESLNIPAIIVEKNKNLGQEYLIEAKGTVLNNTDLQKSAYSSGFFNNIPDSNGVTRSVPLIIKYNNQLYPSLALEIIRASMGIEAIVVNYGKLGIENIQIGNFKIPTDRYGRFIINFRGVHNTFKYYSAVDIYNNNFNPKDIEGKVVLIGTTASGLNDLRSTPFESVFPGVEIHANIIDNIIKGDFIYKPVWVDGANLLFVFIVIVLTTLLITFSPLWLNIFVLTGVSWGSLYIVYYIMFHYGIILNSFLLLVAIFLSVLVTTFLDYIFEIKKEQAIKNKFATKVSKDVMENLITLEGNSVFAPVSKEITIFFSNIRNFSLISEVVPTPDILIKFLNQYVEPMSDIIIKQKGTIDKFMGDSIMAYWNAPASINDHAKKAVDTALFQLYKLKEINKLIIKNKQYEKIVDMCALRNIPPLDIGIGINTGVAVIGEMGTSTRSDYTIIGDNVNLGFKLESLCKYYGSKCNISHFTKLQLPNEYIFRYLDLILVKGYAKPVQVWEVIDFDNADPSYNLYKVTRAELDKELSKYHIGLNMYQDGLFEDALEIFNELQRDPNKTNTQIYQIYIQRCKHFIKEPPKNFDGVYRF